jgi:hypothetical protein
MEQAVMAYKSVAESNELRESLRLSELARHNEASALAFERRQTSLTIAAKMKAEGMSIDAIIKCTGLTVDDIIPL